MWQAWEGGENCTGFWWESLREIDNLRPRLRWEDEIKMDLGKIAWEGVEWIHLA
jgi:hypothetical protein